MTAVRIVLEPAAEEFKPGRFHAVLRCPLKRWRNRPAWIGPSVYFNRDTAILGAQHELDRLEREA